MPLTLPTPPANAPSLSDPTNFDSRTDEFLAWALALFNAWNASNPLVVGDYGWGATNMATAVSDLGTIDRTGIDRYDSGTTGRPNGSNAGVVFTLVRIAGGGAGSRYQVALTFEGYLEHRNKAASGYDPWQRPQTIAGTATTKATISVGAATTVTPPRKGGIMRLHSYSAAGAFQRAWSGQVNFNVTPGAENLGLQAVTNWGFNVSVVAGNVTGSTGTANYVNVGYDGAGNLRVENRYSIALDMFFSFDSQF